MTIYHIDEITDWDSLLDFDAVHPLLPSVTTQPPSNEMITTATGNGTITDTGGENPGRRGFCYVQGTAGDPTIADSIAYEDDSFDAGEFAKEISGLISATCYRIRAYAVNSIGVGYGTTVAMRTHPPADPLRLCPECRQIFLEDPVIFEDANVCPNCGAQLAVPQIH